MERGKKDSKAIVFLASFVFFFLFLALLTPFFPALIRNFPYSGKSLAVGNGFRFLFVLGLHYGEETISNDSFPTVYFLSYLFALLSFFLFLSSALIHRKKRKEAYILEEILILTLLVSAVLSLSSRQNLAAVFSRALTGYDESTNVSLLLENTRLGFGVYGISIFCFLSLIFLFVILSENGERDYRKARIGI